MYNTNSLSMMVDIHVLLNLVLFRELSVSYQLKKNISSLLRLIKNDCIELYASQSTITDCIKYIGVKYSKNQQIIVDELLNIINCVPSHFEDNEQIMQGAYKFWLEHQNLSFDDALLLSTAQCMSYPRILSGSQKLFYDSHISRFKKDYNLQVFDINTLMEWIKSEDKFSEIINYKNQIIVMTPIGDKIELPIGATPIDFAYAIHRDIGHGYHQAIVNGQEVAPYYHLKNGENVEIVTKMTAQPQRDWLKFVVTSKARKFIEKWYRNFHQKAGKDLFLQNFPKEKYRYNGDIYRYILSYLNKEILNDHKKLNRIEELYEMLGSGEIAISEIKEIIEGFIRSLDRLANFQEKPELTTIITPVVPKDQSLQANWEYYQISRCCNPLPDQKNIVGIPFYDYQDQEGLDIHTCQCKSLSDDSLSKSVSLEWNIEYCTVAISVKMKDRQYILMAILNKLRNKKFRFDVRSVTPTSNQQLSSVSIFHVSIHSQYDLECLICEVKEIPDVQSVKIQEIYAEDTVSE